MTRVLREAALQSESSQTLDPQNWDEIRAQGHRMLDDMIDYAANIRERPVWTPIPDAVRARFHAELPLKPSDLAEVYREFTECIVPYATGNVHPGFMGWVHGGGTAVGMLAEMLAAGLNANLGGRDHIPIEVERQVVEWTRAMFGFPAEASGIFVTGTSMANLMAVLVARTAALGPSVRQHGVGDEGAQLTAYTSTAAHGCIAKAMDIAGFGSDALRCIATDRSHRIDIVALRTRIALDRKAGLTPFLVVGSAGTVGGAGTTGGTPKAGAATYREDMTSIGGSEMVDWNLAVATATRLTAIPYHAWANRGVRAMRVWVPLSGAGPD